MQVSSYRPLPAARHTAPTGGTLATTSEPMPLPKPVPPAPPAQRGPIAEAAHDFVAGMKYSLDKLVEFAKHPFDASKREGPWRNPCDPESTAEKIGRLIPGIALAAGAFLLSKVVFKGGINIGGPRVGWR
jgi:hypothetical protein